MIRGMSDTDPVELVVGRREAASSSDRPNRLRSSGTRASGWPSRGRSPRSRTRATTPTTSSSGSPSRTATAAPAPASSTATAAMPSCWRSRRSRPPSTPRNSPLQVLDNVPRSAPDVIGAQRTIGNEKAPAGGASWSVLRTLANSAESLTGGKGVPLRRTSVRSSPVHSVSLIQSIPRQCRITAASRASTQLSQSQL